MNIKQKIIKKNAKDIFHCLVFIFKFKCGLDGGAEHVSEAEMANSTYDCCLFNVYSCGATKRGAGAK